MKTVVLKLVVEDGDKDWAERAVGKCLEDELDEFSAFAFEARDSTRREVAFKKRYDEEDSIFLLLREYNGVTVGEGAI